MKTILNFLLPALAAITLFSCRKKKEIPYPVPNYIEFGNPRPVNFKPYRLFTRDGEVSDPARVQQYAGEFQQFFYYPGGAFTLSEYQKFTMVSPDSLINTGTSPAGEVKRTRKGSYDMFSGKGIVNVDTGFYQNHIMLYKNWELRTTPFEFFVRPTLQYLAKFRSDTLFLPVTRFILINRGINFTLFSSDHFNNVFDASGVNRLSARDTLLVQEFDAALVRKP